MNTEKTILEVGDRLFSHQYGNYSGPHVIERVTATQAFAKHYKFKRELSGKYIRQIGGGKWNSTSFLFESPEILESIRIKNLKNKIASFNFNTLSVEKMEQVYAIIKE